MLERKLTIIIPEPVFEDPRAAKPGIPLTEPERRTEPLVPEVMPDRPLPDKTPNPTEPKPVKTPDPVREPILVP